MRILEAVSQKPPDQATKEWEWLMRQLKLGPEYFLAIYEAVGQGRWRTALNPLAYLKTVAKREAQRMELGQEEKLDHILHQRESVEAVKGQDGVWRSGPGWNRDYDDRDESDVDSPVTKFQTNFREEIPASEEYKAFIEQINASTDEFHIHLTPLVKIHWAKWAREAGLDRWERKVLHYKLKGISRDRALRVQRDETSRKAIQAAWRRFDRDGMKRLLAEAKKISAENVPKS
jgi:hypothetical protein